MDRIKIISLILAAVTCFSLSACGKSEKTDDFTEPVTSVSYVETETTEAPEELKKFTFNSAQELEAISDENLIYIASNSYYYNTSDFLGESFATVDYFDVPMENYESLYIEFLCTDDLGVKYDANAPLPSDKIKVYAEKELDEYFENQMFDPDEGIIDKEIIYCGETDSYVEYSVRCIEKVKSYRDDGYKLREIPIGCRVIYLRNFVGDNADVKDKLSGTLSKEYVQEQFDYVLNSNIYFNLVYREVTEDDKAYYYNYYTIDEVPPDWDINAEALLRKYTHYVEKETQIVFYDGWGVDIKRVEIPDTALILS